MERAGEGSVQVRISGECAGGGGGGGGGSDIPMRKTLTGTLFAGRRFHRVQRLFMEHFLLMFYVLFLFFVLRLPSTFVTPSLGSTIALRYKSH